MTTAPIYERRKARLQEQAAEMAESIVNGNLHHVAHDIAKGRRSTMARAALAARVACKLIRLGHNGRALAFLQVMDKYAVGEV